MNLGGTFVNARSGAIHKKAETALFYYFPLLSYPSIRNQCFISYWETLEIMKRQEQVKADETNKEITD